MTWGKWFVVKDQIKDHIVEKIEAKIEKFQDRFDGDGWNGAEGGWLKKKIAAEVKEHYCPCLVRGTRVLTPRGEVAVEDLTAGDLVVTQDHGALPLRWIGSTTLDAAELGARPALAPIRIKAGALGDGLPRRDLRVSPQHAMLLRDWRAEIVAGVDEALAPAELLVNDATIRPEAVDRVEYFHLLFDTHQVIFAEGAATESYRPCGENHRAFDPARQAEILALFPALATDASAYGPAARPVLRADDLSAIRALDA